MLAMLLLASPSQGEPHWAWQKLGKIMLAITGAEALYADLGHFSRPAIQVRALAAAPAALGREVTAFRESVRVADPTELPCCT